MLQAHSGGRAREPRAFSGSQSQVGAVIYSDKQPMGVLSLCEPAASLRNVVQALDLKARGGLLG